MTDSRPPPTSRGHDEALTGTGSGRDVRVDTVPDPTIQDPTDVIVEITSTGICGSDLHLYEVLGPFLDEGDILGHEPMGVVAEVGPGVTALTAGDRVVVPFNVSCGTCVMCGLGLHSQCETTEVHEYGTGASLFGYTKLYGQVPGGQAEPAGAVRQHVVRGLTGGRGPDAVIDAVGGAHSSPVGRSRTGSSDCCPTGWRQTHADGRPRQAQCPVRRSTSSDAARSRRQRVRRDADPIPCCGCSTSGCSCGWGGERAPLGARHPAVAHGCGPAGRRRFRHAPAAAVRGAGGLRDVQKKQDSMVKTLSNPSWRDGVGLVIQVAPGGTLAGRDAAEIRRLCEITRSDGGWSGSSSAQRVCQARDQR
jgi:hypothetical protein